MIFVQANETPNDLEFSIENFRNTYGRSAASLVQVRRAGAPVVPWFVLSFDAMSRFLNGHALNDFLAEDPSSAGFSARVEKRFAGCSVTPEIFRVLSTNVFRSRTFKGQSLSLRLSAFQDDDANPAQLTPPIYNLRSEFEVLIAIRQAWAMAFSPSVLNWRRERNLNLSTPKVSVMLQASIDAEIGGTITAAQGSEQVTMRTYVNSDIPSVQLTTEIQTQLESTARQLPGVTLRWALWGAQLYFLGESWGHSPAPEGTRVQVVA